MVTAIQKSHDKSHLISPHPKPPLQSVHMELTVRDDIAIIQLALFTILLLIAIILARRHSFNKIAGWSYLALFCVVRFIGAILQLATISDPQNQGLYIGVFILQNTEVSFFLIVTFALLKRPLESIDKTRYSLIDPINPRTIGWLDVLIAVAIILSAIGGVRSSSRSEVTEEYELSDKSLASVIITTVLFVALTVMTSILWRYIDYVADNEKRVVRGVALSLPFTLVRLLLYHGRLRPKFHLQYAPTLAQLPSQKLSSSRLLNISAWTPGRGL
ncbi:hypothetical protein GGS21DRAFT_549458 [Xylaria nigripes]|nr:hypothetical protein GGS21DRAFT_549458 [Xylaria nigripes]